MVVLQCAQSHFVVSVLLSALSISEKVQYGYFSCPGNTLCWISSESEALIGFYTAPVVSSNLALLGAQYSFELEGTLGAQDPLSLKIYLTKMDTFLCWTISQTKTDMSIIQT